VGKTKKQLKSRSRKQDTLPLCTAMLVCEQAIQGKDDVFSAIRIVDTITLQPSDELETNQNVEMPALKLLVMLKQGDANGQFKLLMACTDPNGNKTPIGAAVVNFVGNADSGSNMITPVRIKWTGEGLYWIELTVDHRLIAKTPLRVSFGAESEKGIMSRGD
jgi:hypothetical protein